MTYIRRHTLRRQQSQIISNGKIETIVKENVPFNMVENLGYEIIYSGNSQDENDLSFLYTDTVDLKKIVIVSLNYELANYEQFDNFEYEGMSVCTFLERDADNDLRFKCVFSNQNKFYLNEEGMLEGWDCMFKILKFQSEEAKQVFIHFSRCFNF
jgi:hypothetical protein